MFKYFFIILSALLFSIITFELFLRFSPFEYGLSPVVYDSKIGMWHKKNFSDYKIGECYRTKYLFDENGLPNNIYTYDKRKKDVVILGDSYIEAIMVKNENIIHNSLSKEYNNEFNFLNYGLSGSSPTQQFIIVKEKVDLTNTEYITQFIFLEGDLMDVDSGNLGYLVRPKVFVEFQSLTEYNIIPPRNENLYDIMGDIMGNFQLYSYIKKFLYYVKDNIVNKKEEIVFSDTDNTKKIEKDLSKNWLYLKGAIYQINKIAKGNSIKYKAIIVSENTENINIIKNFFHQNNIEYLIINEQKDFILKGFDCDSHWNDITHINIAKYLKKINFYKQED